MKVIDRQEPSPWILWGIKLPDLSGSKVECVWCKSDLEIEAPADIGQVFMREDESVYFDLKCPVCTCDNYFELEQVADKALPGWPVGMRTAQAKKPCLTMGDAWADLITALWARMTIDHLVIIVLLLLCAVIKVWK